MPQKLWYALILCFSAVIIYACTYDHQVLQVQRHLKGSMDSIEKVNIDKSTNTTQMSTRSQKVNELSTNGKINASSIQPQKQTILRQNESNRRGISVSSTVQNHTAFRISGQQIYDQMIAVIIGIDHYQNLGRGDQLNYAVHDARGVATLLKDKYSFKTITLYNENATRARIMKILQGDLTDTGANDAVLIYFAGHGITLKTPQGMLGYLLPSDGSVKRNEMHKNISMHQIKSDICPLIQAKHVLIIADACFGGLLLSTRATNTIPSNDFSYLKEITSEQVRQIITAGGMDERVLDEGRGGHSVFTGRLIEKLEQIDRYITARQLGEDLKQKVYSDAMSRGHTQRPLVGEIYGVGDFVFIPDFAKKQQAMNEKINLLQSEIEKLEALKLSARQLKSKAQLREIEREQLLKQARLKQMQLKQQAAERELRLHEQALAEEQRQLAEAEQRQQEQSHQLAMLKQKADQLRKEVGIPAIALGIDDSIKEIKEINSTLHKLETEFSSETQRQIKPVRQYYESKIKKITDQRNQPKSMYETKSDYRKRVAQFDRQISEIQSQMNLKIADISQKIDNGLHLQKKPLLNQRSAITRQVFPIGIGNVSFKVGFYDAEKQQFFIFFEIKEKRHTVNATAFLPIPKKKAAEYAKHKELLVPDVNLKLNNEAELISGKFSFSGPERDEYVCKSVILILKGSSFHQRDRLVVFNIQTVLDTQTGLMWASEDNACDLDWYEAKRYCENYRGGGYTDWRLPKMAELEELYRAGYKKAIKLTGYNLWGVYNSEIKDSSTISFYLDFRGGISHFIHKSQTSAISNFVKFHTSGLRVLPVRGVHY
jgi:uncharacterized caspase-like protein